MSEIARLFSRLDMRWVLVALVAALDIWCFGLVARSNASRRDKWLWIGIILLCPLVGCMFWYVLGPKPDMLRRDRR